MPAKDMNRLKTKRLMVVPEGPVAHDGEEYRYSKGERNYLDNLASYFSEVTVYAFVQRPGDPFYDACSHSPFAAKNIKVAELQSPKGSAPSLFSKTLQFLRILLFMVREVKDTDYVYLFLPGYPSAMTWLATRLYKKPHFVYAADDWEQATPGMFKWESLRGTPVYWIFKKLNIFFEHRIAKSALFAVTAGQSLLAKYDAWGVSVSETTPRIILNRNDLYIRTDTCQSRDIRLLNVGSLVFDKAQHLLIDAVSQLQNLNDRRIFLDLLGEGPLEEELKHQVRELGLEERVVFHGHIQDEVTLYSFFKKADIFVLSSVSEGFPRVLYEAMAHSLPIVTTDCGGIPFKMTNNSNAIVCPSGSIEALTNGVAAIIDDMNLRTQIIDGGRKTIEHVFDHMNPGQIVSLIETAETTATK